MTKKVLSYGAVGLLAAVLLGGTAYALLTPTVVEAKGGPTGGPGRSGENREIWQDGEGIGDSVYAYGQGQGRSASDRAGEKAPIEWETLTGTVILVDHEVAIDTADGEVLVGMGQSAFWEHFALNTGDQITVTGFSEDGEFKAGTVENHATGESLTLRDQTGRPVWSGQGRGRRDSSGAEESGRGAGERGQAGGMGSTEWMAPIEWETRTGKVILVDHEVTIETADGEVLVGMGQSAFWEHFALNVGDQVTVTGFSEDGEFKAGTVENHATGESLTLRDQTGRPVWSGQGRLKNQ